MTSRFPDRLRLLPDFEPHPLAADLTAVEKAGWTAHFVKQNRDGEWSAIALRGEKGETHWVRLIYSDPGYRDFADTPLLAATRFLCVQVLDRLECPSQAVRLMRLAPGSQFKDGVVRLHVPVATNAEADFRLNGWRRVMPAGSTLVSARVGPAQRGQPGRNRAGPFGHRCRG